jgi:Zn-dependent protease
VGLTLQGVLAFVLLIPSITFHEFMHGYAAYRLGDPTAKNAGRLTMNPIKSIDPFGSILLPLVGVLAGGAIFGYAKPVPYNPMYFKNLRQGEIIVGFAGPTANLLLAAVGVGLAWLAVPIASMGGSTSLASAIFLVGGLLAQVNLVLMFFNLLPIPPLDGGRIVTGLLPETAAMTYMRLERWGILLVLFLVFLLPRLTDGVDPVGWALQNVLVRAMRFVLTVTGNGAVL